MDEGGVVFKSYEAFDNIFMMSHLLSQSDDITFQKPYKSGRRLKAFEESIWHLCLHPFKFTRSKERYLSGTNIKTVERNAFSYYPDLVEIFFRETSSQPCQLEDLEPGVFDNLPKLESLGIIGCGQLAYIPAGVLGTFQNLETLHIYRSGLKKVPDLSQFKTLNPDMNGLLRDLRLEQNDVVKVEGHAFTKAIIVNLYLNNNPELRVMDEKAFEGADDIMKLDLSNTAITNLPTKGLGNLRHLVVKNTPTLKQLPSVLEFNIKFERAELTYPHHCCAFKNPEIQDPSAWKAMEAQEAINKECSKTTTAMPTSAGFGLSFSKHAQALSTSITPPAVIHTPITFLHNDFKDTMFKFRTKRDIDGPNIAAPGNNSGKYPPLIPNTSGNVNNKLNDILSGSSRIENKIGAGGFQQSTVAFNENVTLRVNCGDIFIYNRNITCTPEPDAFNPCEDVMGYVWLRVTVWFVLLAALLGNSVVLIVLISSRGKFTVPKFLMCNLAFADFIMGVYLILLASIDIHTLGEYFNYAIKWQNEGGCQAAGFLSVFSSELSIFTLTILTLERWYAISHAIHLNKRLKLRHSLVLMFLGYTFAMILALLPLVGVSGYGNVSICLPMKINNNIDSAYVISLLIINGVLFLAICSSYVSMYLKVKGSATTARSNDATIAKRMALLVLTNFACWAPIAFFGLTASAGLPLIDITNSKILLVFFYPLNSCANPFLYAILTKQFRKDLFILLGKYGICVERANMYRVTYTSRSMSHSRGGNKDFTVNQLPRQSESMFSHILESALSSKHSSNGTPKLHAGRQDSAETKPFIERSHLDRAAEFANKEPVLVADDVAMETWETSVTSDLQAEDRPSYVRSVSGYNQFNVRKISSAKFSKDKTRSSVETFLSSETDTTYVSDSCNVNSGDDIWEIREDCAEMNTSADPIVEIDDDEGEHNNYTNDNSDNTFLERSRNNSKNIDTEENDTSIKNGFDNDNIQMNSDICKTTFKISDSVDVMDNGIPNY
ncbi:hypothetical protein ACF0H5_003699 [Mactra antiquata]